MSGEGASDRPYERALGRAYRYLGHRDRSVAELRAYLDRKGTEPELADRVLERLLGEGLLDDERFAARFAADKRELSGWGSERIEAALLDHGVARDLAAAASAAGHAEELATAVALLERRPPPAGDRERDKALRFLVRRGFPLELAYDAVRARERS